MSKQNRSTGKPANKGKAKSSSPNWLLIAGGAVFVLLIAVGVIFLRPGASTPTTPAASGVEVAALPAEISVEQAKQMYDSGTFLLDVRQPEEWNEAHIPNTTLIPLGELSNRLSELPKDQQIVVVCRSGNRSQQGRDILASAGFAAVTSMAGGVNQWKAAGYPTVTGP